MNVAILGYGDQGSSACNYWHNLGHTITICDSRQDIPLPSGVQTQLGPDYLKNLDRFDIVVRAAPSIHPRDIVAANSPDILQKVTSNTNEFMRVCPTKHIIGVTGTKGKGTTCTLIARMLEAAGFRTHLGGNIGVPPLELLNNNIQPSDWVVLELANFQLIDLKYSPSTAVCLMVVPEHLNWHEDMDEYILAKAQLFEHQTSSDLAIFYAHSDDSRKVVGYSPALKIPYFAEPGAHIENDHITITGKQICHVNELKLLGEHNWQNVCAAVTTAWQFTQNTEALRSVLTSFSGMEHRLEFVRELHGVKYYDDSFGTTPETAIVAIKAFKEPKVVILGGSTKNSNYEELARVIATSGIRKVILIGNPTNPNHPLATPDIQDALQALGFENVLSLIKPGGPTIDEVVRTAQQAAQPGDVVLLSTACASFDMFTDYKDRGNKFKQAVQALV